MKYLSPEEKLRQAKLAKIRWLRKNRRRRKPRVGPVYSRVVVPGSIDFQDNYDQTAQFFDQVRAEVLHSNKHVLLDFGSCTFLSADAGLVLAAEVDRCRALRTHLGRPTLTGTYPNDESVEVFLQALGFYKHLGLRENFRDLTSDTAQWRFIQIKSGVRDKGEVIKELAEAVFGDVVQLDERATYNLFRGMVEAMNNVTKHAYDPELAGPYPIKKGQWWMAGYWDRETRQIMTLVYDQGVGIPATLPRTHPTALGRVREMFGLSEGDGQLIRASMKIGETQTGKTWHGKGMDDLKRFVDIVEEGDLRILSRRGSYLYSMREGKTHEVTRDSSVSLGGTLIQWRICDHSLVKWPYD